VAVPSTPAAVGTNLRKPGQMNGETAPSENSAPLTGLPYIGRYTLGYPRPSRAEESEWIKKD
jgi:hypothetical protein